MKMSSFVIGGDNGNYNLASWVGKPNQMDILSCLVCYPESRPVPPPPNKTRGRSLQLCPLASLLTWHLDSLLVVRFPALIPPDNTAL